MEEIERFACALREKTEGKELEALQKALAEGIGDPDDRKKFMDESNLLLVKKRIQQFRREHAPTPSE